MGESPADAGGGAKTGPAVVAEHALAVTASQGTSAETANWALDRWPWRATPSCVPVYMREEAGRRIRLDRPPIAPFAHPARPLPTRRMSFRSLSLFAATAAAFSLSACDNPACVFGGTCQNQGGAGPGGSPGGLGGLGAMAPEEGEILTPTAPTLDAFAPDTGQAHPRTPVFLQFSESINENSLEDAFEIQDAAFLQPVPILPPVVVGDGRVVVLIPATPLLEGRSYNVAFTEEQRIADLNGQALGTQSNRLITTLTVDTSNVMDPRVIYAYPNDGSTLESDTSEIVIGFDRPMDPTTFDETSFDVQVGGAPPALDPAPEPLSVGNIPGVPTQNQVFIWDPTDGSGRVRSYGADERVVVTLSPNAAQILSEEGDPLPLTETAFTTLEFSAPVAVRKPAGALPEGAFGRADVFGGAAPILEIELGAPAPSSTAAEIYLFGTSPSNEELLRSLVRVVDIPQGAMMVTASADDLSLLDGAGDVQFADGDIQIAVLLRRNALRTGARLFDADPSTETLDTAFFDTSPPTLLGLGPGNGPIDMYVSDVRDFAAVGRASEPVTFAFASVVGGGNNGGSVMNPPETAFSSSVPGTDDALFISAPVPVGALDPNGVPLEYEIVVYDRAFNASAVSAIGTFDQRGVVGPGAAPTGSNVRVRVLDAVTLAPIEDANVYSHQESAGAVSFIASAMSGMDGRAQVMGAAADATLISVDAAGYDLFTFHGVPRDAVDILLVPTGLAAAAVSGDVTAAFPTGNFVNSTNVVADTRAVRGATLFPTGPCAANPQTVQYECRYGPLPIGPRSLGAASFLATEQTLPQAAFNPLAYMRGFALRAPLAPVDPGEEAVGVDLDAVDQLVLLPPLNQALAVPEHTLEIGGLTSLGAIDGEPEVAIEAVATGLADPLTVGRAIPYSTAATTFTALGAIAGVASPAGMLETRGAIDPDLFMRATVRDMDGNIVEARPRISTGGGMLTPIDVPRLLSPAPGGMAGGFAFNAIVADTLPDSAGGDGYFRLHLEDSSGRGWTIVHLDTNDAAGDIVLSVPDLAAQGGSALEMGTIEATVEVFGADFTRGHFLYTDLARERTHYGFAAAVTFQLP